jgi:putative thioredoxin
MTQRPFSRPGAIDLSGFNKAPVAAPTPDASGMSSAYCVQADEQNFQAVVEASMQAPVMLVFYSSTRSPGSVQLANDLQVLSNEFEGKFLLGRVDIETAPAIAQAMQVPSVPMVAIVVQGRPQPLFQDAVPLAELRPALTQLFQQLLAQGVSGQHQPRHAESADGEPEIDPRYAPAQDALERGDIDAAVAEYEKLVAANAHDTEAAGGLAMAKVLQRTLGVDLQAARTAAAESPDDVAAQTLVADLDLLGGHVEDAFRRLIDVVRRTSDSDRDAARNHLIGLFAAVGNEDQRVLKARRDLASALF